MSSPRSEEPSNGIIFQHASTHGPVRLPETDADSFVREFNRTYAALGMSAQPIPDAGGGDAGSRPAIEIRRVE